MQIVIKISDEYAEQFYLNKCKDKFDNLATNEFGYVLRKAFENATPLPDHHGRLIDADTLEEKVEKHREMLKISEYDRELVLHYTDIEMAPTIIEVDEEKQDARI